MLEIFTVLKNIFMECEKSQKFPIIVSRVVSGRSNNFHMLLNSHLHHLSADLCPMQRTAASSDCSFFFQSA